MILADVENACDSDVQALLPAIEAALEKELDPSELRADALYGSDDNCQEAEQYGVEISSPAMGTEKQSGTALSDFQFREEGHVEICPANLQPLLRRKNPSVHRV